MYNPTLPTPATPAEVPSYLSTELQALAKSLQQPQPFAYLQTLNVAPIRPREGLIAKADGTNWNPGSGAGVYGYIGGAWVKFGGGGGGMTNPMTTAGDIIVGGVAGAPARLAIGSAAQVLTVVAGAEAWATPAAGLVQGRLTLLSGSPVPFPDQVAKTNIYFTPYKGNLITLWDGSNWTTYTFSEITLALGTLVNATNYDIYGFQNSGTPSLDPPLAWRNSGQAISASTSGTPVTISSAAHGLTTGDEVYISETTDPAIDEQTWTVTVLTGSTYTLTGSVSAVTTSGFGWMSGRVGTTKPSLQDGRLCKTGDKTRLYLGSFRTTATTTTEDSRGGLVTQVGGKRFVFNYYNRVHRDGAVIDSTSQWAASGSSLRQADGAAGNQIQVMVGVGEEAINANCYGSVFLTGSSADTSMGLGLDNTLGYSKYSRQQAGSISTGGGYQALGGTIKVQLVAGMRTIRWLEKGGTATTILFLGAHAAAGGSSGIDFQMMM